MNPQCLVALEKANRSRLAGAEIRREIRQGLISVTAALYDERAGSLTVMHLLGAQHGWGPFRVRRLMECVAWGLNDFAIRETKRVRELTERQRAELAHALLAE